MVVLRKPLQPQKVVLRVIANVEAVPEQQWCIRANVILDTQHPIKGLTVVIASSVMQAVMSGEHWHRQHVFLVQRMMTLHKRLDKANLRIPAPVPHHVICQPARLIQTQRVTIVSVHNATTVCERENKTTEQRSSL